MLFGSPVPGYQAPAERTTEPGTRVIVRLVGILADAYAVGALQSIDSVPVQVSLSSDFARIRSSFDIDLPDAVIARGVLVWTGLFGAVNFEVFGQYGRDTLDTSELFEHHLAVLADTAGFVTTNAQPR